MGQCFEIFLRSCITCHLPKNPPHHLVTMCKLAVLLLVACFAAAFGDERLLLASMSHGIGGIGLGRGAVGVPMVQPAVVGVPVVKSFGLGYGLGGYGLGHVGYGLGHVGYGLGGYGAFGYRGYGGYGYGAGLFGHW